VRARLLAERRHDHASYGIGVSGLVRADPQVLHAVIITGPETIRDWLCAQ